MQKVLLVLGDAAEATDTFYPYFRVQEAGCQVVVAGPEQREYHLVIHDTHPDWDVTVESKGYTLSSDIAFRDISPEEYAALVVTGGRAPEYLRYDEDLMGVVRHFFSEEKPVGCVCHGIEILAAAGVIEGRNVTTVGKCRYDAEFSGGHYEDEPVVVDGNLVTARTYWDSAPWMREFIRLLQGSGE
jgi:protease I